MSIEICNFFVFLLLLFSFDLPSLLTALLLKHFFLLLASVFCKYFIFYFILYIFFACARALCVYAKKDWHVGQPSNYYFLDLELRTISAILKNIYIKSE